MRKLPVAMIISMICHGAAIAWVVRDGGVLAVPLRVEPRPVTVPAAAADRSEPVAVVLLDAEPAPAPVADARDRALDRPAPRRRQPSGDAARGPERPQEPAFSVDGARGAEEPHGEPTHSRWLTMRRPEQPVLEPSPEFVEDFVARSKPLAPPPDIPGERLAGEIADLRKRLRRARNQAQIDSLRAQIVARNRELAAEELKPAGRGTYAADKQTFTASVAADGSVDLKDKPRQMDWQDRMMLSKGVDPYARNKLALLDRTRDQRVAVGERHRREQLGRATFLMQNNIDRLWATTTDLAARKVGLFELWDDCAETGSEEIAAAAAARSFVIGVIRGRLRGADAYTAAELAALNARRRSSAVFAPYE